MNYSIRPSFFHLISIAMISIFLAGCPGQKEATKEELPPPPPAPSERVPDITLQVASLNLSAPSRKLEKKDIEALGAVVRREQIDILAVQGITRYPGIETRIDFVEEFAREAGMRKSFGETINVSGRQNGNAVFTAFPIRTSTTRAYDGIRSASLDGALAVLIDGGAHDVAVVSTWLSGKPPAEDQARCAAVLALIQPALDNNPMIICSNLEASQAAGSLKAFRQAGGDGVSGIWYTPDGMKLISSSTVRTDLGRLTLIRFGLYRQSARTK